MIDDLEKFHARNTAADPHYAIARQLFDLGEAVTLLRENAGLTRGQLGKLLGVKARDIEIVEEDTPLAPAGVLEAALSLLIQKSAQPQTTRNSEVTDSIRTVRHLRPALVAA
jgi:hypothetical protein